MKQKVLFISLIILIPISGIIGFLKYLDFKNEEKVRYQILNRVETLEELVTAKQIYREIIYSKQTTDILWIPVRNKEFLISLDYWIIAGIDLSKGYNVAKNGENYIITLPKSEILSIDAKDSSLVEHQIRERFSTITRDDYFTIINETKKNIIKSESITELLRLSEDNAKNILKSLLSISGINVEVEFSNNVIKVDM